MILKRAPLFFLFLAVFSIRLYAANIEHINQQELIKLQEDENTLLLDVRTAREYRRGHIPNAVNITHSDIINNPELLKQFEGKNVVMYCHSGVRVNYANKALQQSGLADKVKLFHLKGDFRGWQGKGNPIEKPSSN